MSTQIISRTILSVADQRIQLDNSMAARKIALPSASWSELWIGGRWSMEDTGANIVANTFLWMGMQTDPSVSMDNGPLGTSLSTHFVGLRNISNAWTRNTSPVIYYTCPGLRALTRVGTTNNTSVVNPNKSTFIPVTSTNIRVAWILQLLKGSPNWTVNIVCVDGTAGLVDISADALRTAMLLDTLANAQTSLNAAIGGSGTRYSVASAATTLAVNEGTNGTMDGVSFALARDHYIEISDVMVVRKS